MINRTSLWRIFTVAAVIVGLLGFTSSALADSASDGTAGTVNASAFWLNSNLALTADDNQCATINGGSGLNTLTLTNYGFSIPNDATITGISLDVQTNMYSGTVGWVQLVSQGNQIGDQKFLTADGGLMICGVGSKTFGGSTDMLGTTLTPAQVNSSTFGVQYNSIDNNNQLDGVVITIHYTVPQPDLIATAGNDVSGGTVNGEPFKWTVEIENQGTGAAIFPDATLFLAAHLPNDMTYSGVTAHTFSGITGDVDCQFNPAPEILCFADGGSLTIAPGGSFIVEITAQANTVGSYTLPTGGVCKIDFSDTVTESDETNNACVGDTVVVGNALNIPSDFNGDGNSEVVIFRGGAWHAYNYFDGSLQTSVWTGFASPTAYALMMDIDDNADEELTIYDSGAWHFFNNDGSYIKGLWVAFDAIPVPADYDGDGDDDVVLFDSGAWHKFDYATGSYLGGVWTGTGTGSPAYPAPMDFDGDGTDDYTVYNSGAWHFFNDNGTYNKGIWVSYTNGLPVPGDYDGDGTDDVVLWQEDSGGGAWHWFDFATGNYNVGNSVYTGAAAHKFALPRMPAPLDVEGDGDIDRTVYLGGPWNFFAYDGSFIKNIPTGGVAGDVDVSGRPALP